MLQEMQVPEPTEHHALIQRGVGEWAGTVTMLVPGLPETPIPATESVRSAGPFWTVSVFRSDFMGESYEGNGSRGYDPSTGKFQSTWLDSRSSYLSIMEGAYDPETRTMTSTWDAPDMRGEMTPHRSEQVFSKNAYAMTFYAHGKPTMRIDRTRKPQQRGEHGGR